MRRGKILVGALLGLGVSGCAVVQERVATAPTGLESTSAPVDTSFDSLVKQAKLKEAGLIVIDRHGVVYHRLTNGFTTTRPLPIASASKWIAAATIMTGVDRGELSLDDTVGRWIPEAPATMQDVKLRQLLSHTSGVANQNMVQLGKVDSLAQSALRLMEKPAAFEPGSRFTYGGAGFQIAGLMLERAAKKPFADIFAERIAGPLGMKTARFGSPQTWGRTDIPFLGGGMSASLDDYARFLRMMLAKGTIDGKTVLSPGSVSAIETNQITQVPVAARNMRLFNSGGYGLGVWCETLAEGDQCSRVSSAGAFGAYPWLDRASGRAGIFLTRASLAKVRQGVVALREATDAVEGRQ